MDHVKHIDVHLLKKMRQTNEVHALIDVREPDEFEFCHISNCIHIPAHLISSSLQSIPSGMPLVIMCHSGIRSLMVANYLKEKGFREVYNLTGGIDKWSTTIDPKIPRY